MSETDSSLTPSEQTRRALIDAAITLFGRKGYEGTSTRAIAQRAGTNVASIAYHFGGKEALRMACGEAIATRAAGVLGAVDIPPVTDPDEALKVLEGTIATFIHYLLLEQDQANFVAFMLREITEDGPALDFVYQSTFAPRHAAFCALWEVATGQPAESEETRLAVFALIGQVLYFRIGQRLVQRRLGWDGFTEPRVARISRIIIAQLRATVRAAREVSHD